MDNRKTPSLSYLITMIGAAMIFVMSLANAQSEQIHRDTILPVAVDLGANYYRLVEYDANGRRVRAPRAKLRQVKFLPIELASTTEMARGRSDAALIDPFEDFADAITMPDNSRVYRIESLGLGQGILRVSPRGQFQILAWTANSLGFDEKMAVSNHGPFLAIRGKASMAEYGGASLVCVRTDGQVFPSNARTSRGVATPMGIEIKSKSLCFLQGALFANDEEGLFRIDLTTFGVTQVAFPLSNNLTPTYVDSTCAAARDGSRLAIGAGESKVKHDVYTVSASGNAVNQTQWANKYEAALSSEDDGMLLALSPHGERIAYVLDYYYPYAYVADVQSSNSPALFTGADFFPCFIDTIVGLGFATEKTLVFSAGSSLSKLDAYSLTKQSVGTPTPTNLQLQQEMKNLTKTSSTPQSPFLIDSTLELKRRFTAGSSTFLTHEDQNGEIDLQAVNGTGESLGVVSEGVDAVVPLRGMVVILDEDPEDKLRIQGWSINEDVRQMSVFVGLEDEKLIAKTEKDDGTTVCFLVQKNGIQRLVSQSNTGHVVCCPIPSGFLANSLTFGINGEIHCLARRGNKTEIRTWNPRSERWGAKTYLPVVAQLLR